MKTWLREFLAWAITPWKVRQDASLLPDGSLDPNKGWAYRLPVVEPGMSDKVIAAAVDNGRAGVAREIVALRELIGAGSAKHRANPKEG